MLHGWPTRAGGSSCGRSHLSASMSRMVSSCDAALQQTDDFRGAVRSEPSEGSSREGDPDAQDDRERVHQPRRGRAGARRRRRGHERRLRLRRLAHAVHGGRAGAAVGARSLVEAGGFLLGRRTYEIFAAYWPNAPEEEQVIAEPLNTKPKYVASRTLTEPLAWQNSTVLQEDVAEAVAALKQQEGEDLHVIGSSELV